jgi:hypothetical protein
MSQACLRTCALSKPKARHRMEAGRSGGRQNLIGLADPSEDDLRRKREGETAAAQG